MKKDIHPTYYPEARVSCACGSEMVLGSTKESLEVDTCSQCHPFYTGETRSAARGGRVEKFQSRMQKKEELGKKAAPKKPRAKKQEKATKAA